MDKLKEQLAPVQKHLFWIGCGMILVVTLFSWYSATSHLKTEQTKLKGEIEAAVTTVKNVKENHPNDNTIKGMQELIQSRGEEVAATWGALAKSQEKVLVWPASVFDQVFIDSVNSLRPPELTVTDGTNEINGENKRIYRDYVEKVFPHIAAKIGAKWTGKATATGGGMGGMGGMGAMPTGDMAGAMMGGGVGGALAGGGPLGQKGEVDNSIVQWNSGNQSQIMTEHFSFTANEAALPTTRQILYAQEDLWVLEALVNIVKSTNEYNGPITHRHEAAIKVIDSIQMGRGAVNESGKVSPIGKAGSEAGGGEMAAGDDMMAQMNPGMMGAGGDTGGPGEGAGGAGQMMSAMGGMGGSEGGGAAAAAPAAPNPADNRYVDRDYKGVLGGRLVSAMKGEPERPEDLFLAVAKRVPVRMVFKMDQRKLPTLLAECGNSKLPVEVKQVRINRQSAGGGGAGGMMQGGMMNMMMGGAGPGGGEEGGMASMMGAGGLGNNANVNPNRKAISDSTIDPYEIAVELYGIVYIYNPVNRAVLGLSEEAPAAPPAVPVTPTTAGTAPPPTPTPPVNTGAATVPAVGSSVVN